MIALNADDGVGHEKHLVVDTGARPRRVQDDGLGVAPIAKGAVRTGIPLVGRNSVASERPKIVRWPWVSLGVLR